MISTKTFGINENLKFEIDDEGYLTIISFDYVFRNKETLNIIVLDPYKQKIVKYSLDNLINEKNVKEHMIERNKDGNLLLQRGLTGYSLLELNHNEGEMNIIHFPIEDMDKINEAFQYCIDVNTLKRETEITGDYKC